MCRKFSVSSLRPYCHSFFYYLFCSVLFRSISFRSVFLRFDFFVQYVIMLRSFSVIFCLRLVLLVCQSFGLNVIFCIGSCCLTVCAWIIFLFIH
ncbi:hypothetical protein V1514DRAFT_337531, partial [Lipomyces japonicus]|uniref:uncharacterized protein n=1 Tax=Lipomyces japonicus TaxID=56871 RepID=UPI0034CE3D0D